MATTALITLTDSARNALIFLTNSIVPHPFLPLTAGRHQPGTAQGLAPRLRLAVHVAVAACAEVTTVRLPHARWSYAGNLMSCRCVPLRVTTRRIAAFMWPTKKGDPCGHVKKGRVRLFFVDGFFAYS